MDHGPDDWKVDFAPKITCLYYSTPDKSVAPIRIKRSQTVICVVVLSSETARKLKMCPNRYLIGYHKINTLIHFSSSVILFFNSNENVQCKVL